MQEDRGDQPPPTALVNPGVAEAPSRLALRKHDRLVDDLLAAEPRQREHDDVDRDQHHGDPAGDCGTNPPPRVRGWRWSGSLGHALGALEADRRRPHAVRADRPVAALAPDVGLPVGVPVAASARPAACPRVGSVGLPRQPSTPLDLDRLDARRRSTGRSPRPVGCVAIASTTFWLVVVGDLAEDRVLAVQVRASAPTVMKNCEPLVPGPGVRHRQQVRAGRTAARGGTRRRTGSRGRRCRCRAGRRPGS